MKNLLFAILAFTIGSLQAQDGAEYDPMAKKILDQLSAKTKTFSSITAEFTSVLDNKAADIHMTQKGVVKIKGDKYNLRLNDFLIITDGTTTWTYNQEANEVQIDNNEDIEDEDEIKPSALFTIWETGFKYTYVEEKVVDGKNCDIIHLFPKNPADKDFHTIKLSIDKVKQEVIKIVQMGKSGNISTYTVNKFSPNSTISDSDFVFDKTKYPGVEVVDNRM